MNTYKTLFDLSLCLDKSQFALRQDASHLFALLADCQQVELDGLLYAKEGNLFVRNKKTSNRAEAIEQAHYFLHEAFGHESLFLSGILASLKLKRFFVSTKKLYDLYPIDVMYHEVIWRNLFSANLIPQWQQNILKKAFYFTDMTQQTWSTLNTQGYDFAIFPEVNPTRVTGKTRKIVCFRDPIAMTDPDFVSREMTNQFMSHLKQASQDSYFVCDSDSARQKLITFYPQLEKKSCVIPSVIALENKNAGTTVQQILSMRLSKPVSVSSYLLAVNSLNTENNLLTLIHAWEKLNYQYSSTIKLVIVSHTENFSREIKNALRPHIEKNNIILLTGVTNSDLACLYSHATALVAIDYAISSCQSLLAAMHYECPVIAADNYREIVGDTAVFCNPYSESSIADALASLTYADDANASRATLITKGLQRVALFSREKIMNQWQQQLDQIMAEQK
jgi:glycosyltransferase involved in cell wall biosynthesis